MTDDNVGWIGTILGSAALFTLLGIIVRQVIPWRKISIDAEQSFRDGLVKRIEALERQLVEAREELKEEREKSERERQVAAARLEAERALYRHRTNNLDASFSALLLLLKKGVPVEEAVEAIEKMRAEQAKAEALEKAALNASLMQIAEGRINEP